ncbi:transposase [Sphingomonas sp. UV9]|nr:transposase [Sphingomonas sp. UV9]
MLPSLREAEGLRFERGTDKCHETVCHGRNRFGPIFVSDILCQRVSRMRCFWHWDWHLDGI